VGLEDEVSENRQNIRSDGYTMSIGEFLNLYRDREIQIAPEFQRLFRWNIEKQSRLIESLLLDIPIPPVFVAQREDGVWEVVDGLQRLSTILGFVGALRDEETGEPKPPTRLVKTRYLPSLEGVTFDQGSPVLPPALRMQLKRARIDFRILLRESDDRVKYELFDRLNSGGEPTSPQEVRTALVLMADREFYSWLDAIRSEENVNESLALTERQLSEQYDLELIVRFLVWDHSTENELRAFSDVDSFLTQRILDLAKDGDFDRVAVGTRARGVFEVVSALGPNTFRKYDSRRGRTVGAFSVSAFEAATLGIAANLDAWLALSVSERAERLTACAQALWEDAEFVKSSGAGVRATTRTPKMRPVGARIFIPAGQ
jgi:hypothetical protein